VPDAISRALLPISESMYVGVYLIRRRTARKSDWYRAASVTVSYVLTIIYVVPYLVHALFTTEVDLIAACSVVDPPSQHRCASVHKFTVSMAHDWSLTGDLCDRASLLSS
jgi:hypothetical protein